MEQIVDLSNNIHHLLQGIVPVITGILEIIGVLIITYGSIKAIVALFRNHFRFDNEDTKLSLAQSLALALEFKMGAEILKTITVRTMEELMILAAIVLIRVVLTFVIHWEIKTTHEDKKMDLTELKVKETKKNLANKIRRGKDSSDLE